MAKKEEEGGRHLTCLSSTLVIKEQRNPTPLSPPRCLGLRFPRGPSSACLKKPRNRAS